MPEWYVMVDSWLNIPYPEWYLDNIAVHFQAELFPDAFMGAFAHAAKSDDEVLEQVCPHACHIQTLKGLGISCIDSSSDGARCM